MDSDNVLAKYGNLCTFVISSGTIYDDIIKLGGKENKSLDIKFPKVPQKYLPDFVRGLWDGDGSIYRVKQRKTYQSEYTSGSNDFVSGLYCALKKSIPKLKGRVYSKSRDNDYALIFSKNDTVRLKFFMYPESLEGKLMLKRKYDLFLKTPDYICEFLDYNSAQKVAKTFRIKNHKEWKECCKRGVIPYNIPRCPYFVYKNSGWVDWKTWLGTSISPKQ